MKTHKKPLSEESRKKMSESHKGWSPSEEHRRRASEVHTGKIVSKETREKLRKVNLGRHHPEKGFKYI